EPGPDARDSDKEDRFRLFEVQLVVTAKLNLVDAEEFLSARLKRFDGMTQEILLKPQIDHFLLGTPDLPAVIARNHEQAKCSHDQPGAERAVTQAKCTRRVRSLSAGHLHKVP